MEPLLASISSSGTPQARPAAPVLPKAASAPASAPSIGGGIFDPVQAEAVRMESVKRAAQSNANNYVLGDQRMTFFKDSTGQYITRYVSLRDGRVTYIPEPQLMNIGGTSGRSLDLEA